VGSPLELEHYALDPPGEGLGVAVDARAEEVTQPLLAEELAVWRARLGDAVGVEYKRLAWHEAQRHIPELRVGEDAEHPARAAHLLHRAGRP
jgi:hypothetical protein